MLRVRILYTIHFAHAVRPLPGALDLQSCRYFLFVSLQEAHVLHVLG